MKQLLSRSHNPPSSTSIYIGEKLLEGAVLRSLSKALGRQVVLISDLAVKELYGTKLARSLNATLLTIPSGEQAKNQEAADHLIHQLFTMGAGRDTVLIALGGGVTTDLVAFVASIYMRGVPLILIPTTLLAMVDAAIGGKTSIDTPFGKNLIGTFYPPKAVFSDLDTLKTLPQQEWLNGLFEILKMGLVFDAAIWEEAKNGYDSNLICKAIEGKIAVIEQDFLDTSLRRILNFGHTIGHALETISEYTMSHGTAVAMGCIVEAHLSMNLGYLPKEDFEYIKSGYNIYSLQLPNAYKRSLLMRALVYDKKNAMGKICCVLIDRLGHAIPFNGNYCRAIELDEFESTLSWMESTYG